MVSVKVGGVAPFLSERAHISARENRGRQPPTLVKGRILAPVNVGTQLNETENERPTRGAQGAKRPWEGPRLRGGRPRRLGTRAARGV